MTTIFRMSRRFCPLARSSRVPPAVAIVPPSSLLWLEDSGGDPLEVGVATTRDRGDLSGLGRGRSLARVGLVRRCAIRLVQA